MTKNAKKRKKKKRMPCNDEVPIAAHPVFRVDVRRSNNSTSIYVIVVCSERTRVISIVSRSYLYDMRGKCVFLFFAKKK